MRQEKLDDVDKAAGRCQTEGRVVGHVPVLLVGSTTQQQLHNLYMELEYYDIAVFTGV